MKKLILTTLAIFIASLLLVNAQNGKKVKLNKMEKKLVGTWVLSEMEFVNIDEFAKTYYDLQLEIYDEQIKYTEEQLELTENEEEKKSYQQQIDDYEAEKTKVSMEEIINEFNASFDEMLGVFKLIFSKDKTYENTQSEAIGTWFIDKNKSELHITEYETEIIFLIKILNKKELILYLEDGEAENLMQFNMTFKKDN